MPKITFLKLKEEKREKIMEAALNEFANNFFKVASINKIVKDSDIAKGSFYQYFEDKEDLYMYILDMCIEKKEKHLSKKLEENSSYDVFYKLKMLLLGTIEFQRKNTREFSIIDQCGRSIDRDIKKNNFAKYEYFSYKPIHDLLEEEKENGVIDYDLDIKMFTGILSRLNCLIMEKYIQNQFQDDVEKEIEHIIGILKNGIKQKEVFGSRRNIEDRFY